MGTEPGPWVVHQRGGPAAEWVTDNPILEERQVGWETDTLRMKLGDGVTAWNDLPYAAGTASDVDSVAGVPPTAGNIPTADLQAALAIPADTITELAGKQATSEKGVANGYASLDGAGKIPSNQLPISGMDYQGTWNATTNTPTLADGTGSAGDFYKVSVAGTRNLGSGPIDFAVGDYVLYNGTIWEKVDTTDAVSSVAGLIGAISAASLKTALSLPTDAAGDLTSLDGRLDTAEGTLAALPATYAPISGEVSAVANGIVADGTTNDTPAIQALTDSLTALGFAGTIVFPKGNIKLSTAIQPKSGVSYRGAGLGLTVFKPLLEAFQIPGGATSTVAPLTDCHFTDFTVDGTNQTAAGTRKGIGGQYFLRCSWERLHIKNTQMTGLGVDGLRSGIIRDVITENTGLANDGTMPSGNGIGIGCGLWTDSESFLIEGCQAINAKRFGIMVEGGDTVTGGRIIGNSATLCGDAGFGFGAGRGIIVEGNNAYANVGNGFEFGNLTLSSANASGRAVMRGNYATLNGGSGISYDATVHRAASGHTQIIGNTCVENTGHGIEINIDLSLPNSETQLTGFKIDDNICHLNTQSGISVTTAGTVSGSGWVLTGWSIDNNTVGRNSSSGTNEIRISAPFKGSTFRGNVFYTSLTGASRTGLYIGYGAAAITMSYCRFENNTNANSANRAVSVDPAVTLTSCITKGNQPEEGTSPAPSPKITTYTASGTWTPDTTAQRVTIFCVGAGAGGSAGSTAAANVATPGGPGGGGGAINRGDFATSVVGAGPITVTIGAIGVGGAGISASNATPTGTAQLGTNGGSTAVAGLLRAAGGLASTASPTGGTGASPAMFTGGTGGNSSATGLIGANGASSGTAGGGGGAGGGLTTGNVTSAGGAGGASASTMSATGSAGGAAGVGSGNGGDGATAVTPAPALTPTGGASGGGGGSSNGGNGGNGATGTGYGGAGGGGGAARNTFTSGSGGNGSPGFVLIREDY